MPTNDQLAELFVDIDLRTGKIDRDLQRMEPKMERSAKKAERGFSVVGRSIRGMLGPLAALASAQGLARVANETANWARDLELSAKNLGLTTDELQVLRLEAEATGTSVQSIEMAIQRLGRRAGEALAGTGEALNALRALGLLEDLETGRIETVNQLFLESVERLNEIEDVTRRNALAMKLYDSEGVKAVNAVSGAIGTANKRLREQGKIIDTTTIESLQTLEEAITLVSQEWDVFKTKGVGSLAAIIVQTRALGKEMSDLSLLQVNLQIEAIERDMVQLSTLLSRTNLGETILGFDAEAAAERLQRLGLELQALRNQRDALLDRGEGGGEPPIIVPGVSEDSAQDVKAAEEAIQSLINTLRLGESELAGGEGGLFAEQLRQDVLAMRELGETAGLTEEELDALQDRMAELAQKQFLKDLAEDTEDFADVAQDSLEDVGTSFGDLLTDMVLDSERSFGEILAAWSEMISRMIVGRSIEAVVGSLLGGLGGAAAGVTTGTGGGGGGALSPTIFAATAPNDAPPVEIVMAQGTSASVQEPQSMGDPFRVFVENTVVNSIQRRGPIGQAISKTHNLGNPGTPGGAL